MPLTSGQLDKLATMRRPIYTGYYHVRRCHSSLDAATLDDGALVEEEHNVSNGGGYPVYNMGALYFRGGGRPDLSESTLGQKLSRAVCPDSTYATTEYGPITTLLDRRSGYRFGLVASEEWMAMMNVKEWRISGSVGPFSFNETVGAGQIRAYTPSFTAATDGWEVEMTERAAYGFGFTFQDSNDDGAVQVYVRLGIYSSSPNGPLDVRDQINQVPSAWQLVPTLEVAIYDGTKSPDQAAQSAGYGGNAGEGTEVDDITFLGQPLAMRTPSGYDPLEDQTLTIEANEWWTNLDPWFGQV